MKLLKLDPRFTFDSFVVGPSNRLAAAAAKRVADAPGRAYNPLMVHGAPGLGKTHLAVALGHHAGHIRPDLAVVYDTLERLLDGLTAAIATGEREPLRRHLQGAGLLIIDDVQFLAGQRAAQDELLRAWDTLAARGGQLVLTSDRPPAAIDGLDDRLLSRFSGGLLVDLTAPDFETRVAIVNRKTAGRGQRLPAAVARALALAPFTNVRALQGGLNRVLALQELESRALYPAEVAALLGSGDVAPALDAAAERPPAATARGSDEFTSFLDELAVAVDAAVSDVLAGSRIADAVARWAAVGVVTRRLERLVPAPPPEEAEPLIEAFEHDARRLAAIVAEITALDAGAAELARADVLRDPDRLLEAEGLLAHARERCRPLPLPPPVPDIDAGWLESGHFAVKVARAVADAPGSAYNPLFVAAGTEAARSRLLALTANRMCSGGSGPRVAYLSGASFRAELVGAIERNAVDAWRARLAGADALFLHGVDALGDSDRAQEELFHLCEALQRRGAQLVFSAASAPDELAAFDARLRSRLESGIVVRLPAGDRRDGAAPAGASPLTGGIDRWFLDREKVIWEWPDAAAWLVEEAG